MARCRSRECERMSQTFWFELIEAMLRECYSILVWSGCRIFGLRV